MAVDDLWYLKNRGPNGERIPSKRPRHWTRYRVRWVDDAGEEQTKYFHKKGDADRYDVNVRADVSRGEYIDPQKGKMTFGEFAKRYQARLVCQQSTKDRLDSALRTHILPFFGHRPLRSIEKSHVEEWLASLVGVLKPSTITVMYGHVATIFRAAVEDKRMPGGTPCVKIDLPKTGKTKLEPLPVEFVNAMIDAAPPRYRALFILGAGAGPRRGEALGLEVDRIHFFQPGGNSLTINQQLKVMDTAKPFLAPVKTEAGERELPMGELLTTALSRHLRDYPVRGLVMPVETHGKIAYRTAYLVFTTERGCIITRTKLDRIWRNARTEACARYVEGAPDKVKAQALVDRLLSKSTYRHLRHFYASLLIKSGADPKAVQERMGHSTAKVTFDIYGHLWPGNEERTRRAVDDTLGRPLPNDVGASDGGGEERAV